jgi:pimeloyl-ACP methyl ester carboxylesterase
MPVVLVHGVPDTAGMWRPLTDALGRDDVTAVSLPGFGTSPPAGWSATKEEYATWLTAQIEALGPPVDLVAHDWGAILAQRVASVRPELIRTLAVGSGPLDRDYVWHDMAQAWQTPELGEQIVDGMLGLDVATRTEGLAAGGSPAGLAADQAAHLDAAMADCILKLYRSAVTVGREWQDPVEAMPPRPALVLHGADDPYVGVDVAERIAGRLDATLVVYDGCGHWWPWARATETAVALERLWG